MYLFLYPLFYEEGLFYAASLTGFFKGCGDPSYAFSLRLYPLKKTLKKKGKHTKEKITTLFPSKP